MSGIKGRRTEKENVEGKKDKATCKIGEIRRKKQKNNTNKDVSRNTIIYRDKKRNPPTQKNKMNNDLQPSKKT